MKLMGLIACDKALLQRAVKIAIVVGIVTFTRFGRHQKLKLENEMGRNPADDSDEAYRQRLEQDLVARR